MKIVDDRQAVFDKKIEEKNEKIAEIREELKNVKKNMSEIKKKLNDTEFDLKITNSRYKFLQDQTLTASNIGFIQSQPPIYDENHLNALEKPISLIQLKKLSDLKKQFIDSNEILTLFFKNFAFLYVLTVNDWILKFNQVARIYLKAKYGSYLSNLDSHEVISKKSEIAEWLKPFKRTKFLTYFLQFKSEENYLNGSQWLEVDKLLKNLENQRKSSPIGHNSVRFAAAREDISYKTALKMLNNLVPGIVRKYSIKLTPKLTAANMFNRFKYAESVLIGKILDPKKMLFSDESSIISYPKVGSLHCWSSPQNQPSGLSVASRGWSLTVFACVGYDYMSELIFIVKEKTRQRSRGERLAGELMIVPETLTTDNYIEKILEPLNNEFIEKGWITETENGPKLTERTFQQDGCPCHTSQKAMVKLDSLFGLENIVSKQNKPVVQNGVNKMVKAEWPPYSCDLNICDVVVWPMLKRLGILETENGCYLGIEHAISCLKKVWLEKREQFQRAINNSIDNHLKRLQQVYLTNGSNNYRVPRQ